ncbi:catalase [Pararoseomonas sp. SCSIO 73927]|uniref:catalase n=1 Tax=Pararoseomonas sp. SCSIO 73927 TaxID=3114537 RepID=UPI0030D15517
MPSAAIALRNIQAPTDPALPATDGAVPSGVVERAQTCRPLGRTGRAALLSAALLLAAVLPAAANAQPTQAADAEQIVDALRANAGHLPHIRPTFAKGQCVTGGFEPSGEAAHVTRSVSFTRPGRITGRFSVGGGNPAVADTNRAVLRGFSFRIETGDAASEFLMENAPVHFARSQDQMLAFLRARAPGPGGSPDPARVRTFSEANDETLNQARFVAGRPFPGSFAGTTYWGVHAYPATNAQGATRFIKFKVVPAEGEVTLSDEEARSRPGDFLQRDLEQRVAARRVRFDVLALLARPGDQTTDVTLRWPDEDAHEAVRLGSIAITALEPNETCDAGFFDPSRLAEGIGLPTDDIFVARLTAYAISFGKRR